MTDLEKAIAEIIAMAWDDPKFLTDLVAAGDEREKIEAVLKPKKIKFPEIPSAPHAKLRFVANTPDSRYVVIPEKPKFTDEDMGVMVKLRQEAGHCCGCGGTLRKHILDGVIKKIFGDGD